MGSLLVHIRNAGWDLAAIRTQEMGASDEEEEGEAGVAGGCLCVLETHHAARLTRNTWLSAVFAAGYLWTRDCALEACELPW